jgi:phosphoribosylpyrophosphate synthetase
MSKFYKKNGYYISKEGYIFLKKIKIYSKKDLFKKNSIEFSYFKFGVKKFFNNFSKKILKVIKKELKNKINNKNWVIVSRSNFLNTKNFGSISDALAQHLSTQLKISYIISYPSTGLNLDTNYGQLNSKEKRLKEIKNRRYSFIIPPNVSLENKNVIFIDDIINSGVTINTIKNSLLQYNIKNFYVFTIAKLLTCDLDFEYKLSRAILLKKRKKNLKFLISLYSKSQIIITNKLLKIINNR